MNLEDLTQSSGEWLKGDGPSSPIVVSSRVRLARNLASHRFAMRMDPEERIEVSKLVGGVVITSLGKSEIRYFDLEELDELDRLLLVERHLISREQESADGARGVAVDGSETISVMVNEEDHIRLQCLRSGLQLLDAFAEIDRVDDLLSERLDLAFDSNYGYLTACPTNVGTGMRVSVMMHLPALVMTGHTEKAFRAIHDLRLAVRGLYGEGTEAYGEFYQISNQITIGRDEHEIVDDLQAVIEGLVSYELQARAKMLDENIPELEDRVWRGYATLTHARIISSEEAMKHLSSLRLGIGIGLVPDISIQDLNRVFLNIQPAHLQRMVGRELPAEERDLARANYIREQLG